MDARSGPLQTFDFDEPTLRLILSFLGPLGPESLQAFSYVSKTTDAFVPLSTSAPDSLLRQLDIN